jgi:hypothetical protein
MSTHLNKNKPQVNLKKRNIQQKLDATQIQTLEKWQKKRTSPTYYNKHMINDYRIFNKDKRFGRGMLTVTPRAGDANG